MSDQFEMPVFRRKLEMPPDVCPFCGIIAGIEKISAAKRAAIEDEAVAAGFILGLLTARYEAPIQACEEHMECVQLHMRGAQVQFGLSKDELKELFR